MSPVATSVGTVCTMIMPVLTVIDSASAAMVIAWSTRTAGVSPVMTALRAAVWKPASENVTTKLPGGRPSTRYVPVTEVTVVRG